MRRGYTSLCDRERKESLLGRVSEMQLLITWRLLELLHPTISAEFEGADRLTLGGYRQLEDN